MGSTAVLRIGEEKFEVSGRKDGNSYWINGAKGVDENWDDETSTISGFPIRHRTVNTQQREYVVDVGDNRESSIVFKTWKDFVRVDVVGATERNFAGSLGLMGSYPDGKKIGRDGKTAWKNDVSGFGKDWQVLSSDGMLFHEIDGPQHPAKCLEPTKTTLRRRLQKSAISRNDAEVACSNVSEDERDLCVFDVMATNDFGTAGAY